MPSLNNMLEAAPWMPSNITTRMDKLKPFYSEGKNIWPAPGFVDTRLS